MNMRITSGMITGTFLRNLNANANAMDKYQNQLQTGRRVKYLSDDPVGILQSMRARVKIYRSEQYQRNLDDAKDWLSQAETCANELNKVIQLAYENTVQITSQTYSTMDRQATAQLIGQLRDQVLTIANSQESARYIFGGYMTTDRPFTLVGGKICYKGIDMTDPANVADLTAESQESIEFEIGFGLKMETTISGAKVMGIGDENIYHILDNLYTTLNNPASTFDDISQYISQLNGVPGSAGAPAQKGAQDRILSILADIGGRTNRLDLMASRYADDILNYTEIKSRVEDADEAEAIMGLKMAESVYLSALSAGAKIIQPTLLNYLN